LRASATSALSITPAGGGAVRSLSITSGSVATAIAEAISPAAAPMPSHTTSKVPRAPSAWWRIASRSSFSSSMTTQVKLSSLCSRMRPTSVRPMRSSCTALGEEEIAIAVALLAATGCIAGSAGAGAVATAGSVVEGTGTGSAVGVGSAVGSAVGVVDGDGDAVGVVDGDGDAVGDGSSGLPSVSAGVVGLALSASAATAPAGGVGTAGSDPSVAT
jgi:hypothetical protein